MDQKDEIKQRNDIVDVVSDVVALKRSGSTFKGLCPFHEEKTPSFTVSREKQVFHCFGCGAGGDVVRFVQQHDGLDFVQAMQKLAERVGMRFTLSGDHAAKRSERDRLHAVNALAAKYYRDTLLQSPPAEIARVYLAERGIDDAVAERFQLGYATDSWDALGDRLRREGVSREDALKAGLLGTRRDGTGHYDWFRARLMFPIWDVSGNIVGFGGRTLKDDAAKYVNTPDTAVFNKGDLLYGLNLAARDISAQGEAVLVEGYMDAIALHQFGVTTAVATMGTAVTPRAARTMARYAKSVAAAFDGDSAGMTAVVRGAAVFQEQDIRVRIVEVPEGIDPDDWIREAGTETFREAVRGAVSLIDYRLNRALRELPEESREVTAEMVRQVVPILCDVRSDVERADHIKRLAHRWSYPDTGRERLAEEAILQELRRVRSQASRSRRRPRPGTRAQEEPPPRPKGPLPGYVKAEHELLSAAVHDGKAARYVKESLSPEEFADPTSREAAAALFAHVGGMLQVDVSKVIESLENDEANALLSRLALAPPAMSTEEPSLDRHIEAVRDRSRRRRLEELRREIPALLEKGELSSDDPRFQEFQELERHFRQGVKNTDSRADP